jgi:hypothetical protein
MHKIPFYLVNDFESYPVMQDDQQQQLLQRVIETITLHQDSLVIELRAWNNFELNRWFIVEKM